MRGRIPLAAVLFVATVFAGSAAAENPYPVGPPHQPATYGDCVSTVAAPSGEGVEDQPNAPKDFTRTVMPVNSRRPGFEQNFGCKGFSPP